MSDKNKIKNSAEQQNKNRNKQGFTLIELIVSVTIIAVVTVVAIVNYVGINQKARDSKRMADLEKIRVALELSRQIGTTYPTSVDSLVPIYLQAVPVGPKGDIYAYSQLTNYSYTLDASLEGTGSVTGSYPGSNCGGVNFPCNYRVINP